MNKPPKGLDQQGRYPEAAEAATEVGVGTDDTPEALGAVVVMAVLVIVVLVAISFLAGYYS